MALKLRICVRFASTFNVERVAVLTYDLVICKDSNDCLYLYHNFTLKKNKLKNFGICGKLGEWLHSFLTNRRQHVRIPGGVSKGDNVLSGVPQGTVLGPVLFLVLISDISSNVSSNITSFADDTKVFEISYFPRKNKMADLT